jgi:uncharacterized protein involved in exopolysaccharide biosynthesis
MKPAALLPFVPFVLAAIRRYWVVPLVGLAIGIVLGTLAYTQDIAGIKQYFAPAMLGIAPVNAPGVTPPCSAENIPTLVASPTVIGDKAAAQAAISATIQTPALVRLLGTAMTLDAARSGVNDAADSIAASCKVLLQSAMTQQINDLNNQLTVIRANLAKFDKIALASSATSSDAATLQKQIDDFTAKKQALEDKAVAQSVVAATASTAFEATIPVGFSEVRAADARWVALENQYNADSQLYDTVASRYKPTAPRVIDLRARVATDEATMARLRTVIDQQANLMKSPTYAKAFDAQQSAQSVYDQLTAQIALYADRIAALQAKLPKSDATTPAVLDAQRQSQIQQEQYTTLLTELAKVTAEADRVSANPSVTVAGSASDASVGVRGRFKLLAVAVAIALLCLVFGIVIAVIILILDDRLVTTKQITKLYAKPVIATLEPKS